MLKFERRKIINVFVFSGFLEILMDCIVDLDNDWFVIVVFYWLEMFVMFMEWYVELVCIRCDGYLVNCSLMICW